MNKQELINEITKTKEHLANMEKMLAECEHERWKPKNGQEYYYSSASCKASQLNWRNTERDVEQYRVYNCFQTKEQAEQEAEKILVRRMLEDIARRLNKGKKIDWSNGEQIKYCIVINEDNDIRLSVCYTHKTEGTVYCLKENIRDIAIQEIGKERLKNYLRGE